MSSDVGMGGIKNDHELQLWPSAVLQQRLEDQRDQERFRKDLWGKCRLFIAGLLGQSATYCLMEEVSHLRGSLDDGRAVCLLMAANICETHRGEGL